MYNLFFFVFAYVFISCIVPVIGRELLLGWCFFFNCMIFKNSPRRQFFPNLCLCLLVNSILCIPRGTPHLRFPYVTPQPEAQGEIRSLLKSRGSWIHLVKVFFLVCWVWGRTKEKSAFLWHRAKIVMPVISKPSRSPKVGVVQK